MRTFPRRWWLRGGLAVVVLVLFAQAGAAALDGRSPSDPVVKSPAAGETMVSVQGVGWGGSPDSSPARLFIANERGNVTWRYNGAERGLRWLYDVDPMPNGNYLVTATKPGDTLVFELDPENKTRVWTQRLDAKDTHDVDLINGDELLVGNMRNYNETTGVSHDRVFVYNLTRDEVVWEWEFRNHYPPATDSGHGVEWTHTNDVDKIGDGRYLVSPRDFDQVIVINRTTKEIEMKLGEDGNRSKVFKQHNPDYLEGKNGRATILVADSENDRVVEYTRIDGEWERTWKVVGFHWPRDADRLPNGNTLVTDTKHNRVVEITPTGKVVWSVDAHWGTYEAERGRDGSQGPTIREQDAEGTYRVHGGTYTPGGPIADVRYWLASAPDGTPVGTVLSEMNDGIRSFESRVAPNWLNGWPFTALVAGALLTTVWGLGELAYRRRADPEGDWL